MVNAKILETMKRGIAQARDRTDLAAGELQMLEHMKMYVMETQNCEDRLDVDERQIWEQMKQEYMARKDAKKGTGLRSSPERQGLA